MNDEDALDASRLFADMGIKADLRLQTYPDGRIRGRSSYYDDERRLLMADYEPVDPEEVPDDDRLDDEEAEGVAYYLKESEGYHLVEELQADPMIGESRGWYADASDYEPAGYIPVSEAGRVLRIAENLPVAAFLLEQHTNLREDVFEDGGVFDDLVDDEVEA